MKLSYLSTKTAVRNSGIHGRGLFAKEAISAGEIVAVKGGSILTAKEWAEIEPTMGSAEIQIAENLFIAPEEVSVREGSMIFSNHSCQPNIGIQGQIVFVAMRNIIPGEELTHDWATADDGSYRMECACGAVDCRKIINGKDWMKPELQDKYRGWFAWFLQRKIDKATEGPTNRRSQ